MTVWYLQRYKGRNDYTANRLVYTIKEMGYELVTEEYEPYKTNLLLPTDKPVVFHGSIACALNVRERKLPFYPFAWFDPEKLKCSHYYVYWNRFIAQRVYGFYPFGILKDKNEWLYKVYGHSKEGKLQIFIRPDTNDKLFVGETVPQNRFESWLNQVTIADDMVEALVIVSRPETFLQEWRLIIADGKVITGSRYMDRGMYDTEKGFPDEAAFFAEEAAKVWSPHQIYCMDVASTPNGFRIMECGSINCAGYYESNLKLIVKTMSEIAEREFNVKEKEMLLV